MSVEIPYCQSTGRSFEVYCCLFGYGLDGQGLVGKKILDIAAGRSNFAKEVQGKFPTTTAVGIDIKLNWHSQKVDGEIVLPGPYMVAAAQILPFRKDSFDDVLISNLNNC
ncbi:MAG: hypothetical protein U1C56_00725, partial [Candidatus Curtissbacteria bacterium]|nr:hypothetical protein [Candidatus Curtissbacteria bacterium]